ncbi:MAG: chloride channel protein [Rhodospirillaceae bacterium]|jgi:chloride channel protein, CIC family|nr:chloride channel protein [Rhodospirillaceae bacterium]MBT5192382.1 chloride channel protein [Rhodospirillaceae bacterium]MBT6428813.1 chloride channel protein [Rhodospirillaceae bacterium]MBT7757103.1 chloride channel protein [Rhodospirillaceae bacterium]
MGLAGQFARTRRLLRNDQALMAVIAAVVGVLVAYAAIAFRLSISSIQWLSYGVFAEELVGRVAELPIWQVLLIPTVGGLLVGLFLQFVMPGGRAMGVAHVIEAMALRNGRMRLRDGLAAALVSVVSLGVGASGGREGPMVHLGASIAGGMTQRLGLSPHLARTLLGCGVAASVAASFNAPIAGVFFALEVIIGHYALSAFAPVVIASVAGTVVCRAHLGEQPAFILPQFGINSLWEFPAFMVLGVVCAAIAIIFMWSIFYAERVVDSLSVPNWLKPAAGGLAVGAIAVEFPHVLGVGYEATDAALNELLPLWLLLLLIPMKTAATAISLGCRFGGGVFSPSLCIGAMTGAAFGIIAASVFPDLAASHGAYAIVGMSALAAATLGAPISTILIVFELTGDYQITVAVMVATSIASVIVQGVLGRSFFHWQLENRGLNLRGGRARHLLQSLAVRDVLATDFECISERTSIAEIKSMFARLPHGTFVVVDHNQLLVGTISFADLKHIGFDSSLDSLINARDVAHTHAPAPLASDTLENVLAVMDVSGEEHLAVIEAAENRRVLGVVHHSDVLRAYNRALLEAQAEEHDDNRP